ncbi:hypothetical protein Tb10.70.1270 [Trypanosoma brucei brucei TREU927]|uniref:T. brucei spp.-specific protein n=1 Tax=Trypanosoma brucei brucei (strain 927/4 GUTat10.1) TaxID=185431 RepID=Q38B32_TRYB2|nr:hypothetical protein Tb10.70.1270 [Trypanosoma brucei brucei TREU927]EAN77988.1 hypothetical protein Tb10.70.1270 [Trypanosoma brucei brucei TREU927]
MGNFGGTPLHAEKSNLTLRELSTGTTPAGTNVRERGSGSIVWMGGKACWMANNAKMLLCFPRVSYRRRLLVFHFSGVAIAHSPPHIHCPIFRYPSVCLPHCQLRALKIYLRRIRSALFFSGNAAPQLTRRPHLTKHPRIAVQTTRNHPIIPAYSCLPLWFSRKYANTP